MQKYSKRTFLKFLGLGIAFAPFISLYSACNDDTSGGPGSNSNGPEEAPVPETEKSVKVADADPNDIILLKRDDAAFAEMNVGFNARIKKMPKYIAVCKTTKGVQYAIALATSEQLPVAVRSGGHSFEGFSSNDGGLVINLSRMDGMDWQEGHMISLGPGCLLRDIQKVTFAEKRLIPAGSCGTVGIAGLTLGGGYGFFSRKYGLTCDNLIEVEFVDGLGNIHQASKDDALFWALRGGGNGNFGVATKFIFRTQPMPAQFVAHTLKFRGLDAGRFTLLLRTWFECAGSLAPEDFCAFVLNGRTLTVLATTFGDAAKLAGSIAPLLENADSKVQSTTALPEAMKRYHGRNGPILFKNASAGLYKGYEDIASIAGDIFEKVVAAKGMIYQINTLGGAIDDEQWGARSCYPHRALPFLSELQAYWERPAQEAALLAAFGDIQTLIREQGITAQYRNYPDIDLTNWQEAYYGSNYSTLQEVKKRLDPKNVFQHPQSIVAHDA